MNESPSSVEINVRAPLYYIARTRGVCPHCHAQTDLFALALSSEHDTLDDETDAWILASDPALIFHIDFLNAEVASRLALITGSFRIGKQDAAAEPTWVNHCQACGSSLEDEDLFCEPGEAFFPTSDSGAAAIRLQRVEAPLEAAAGGYSVDPNFFHAMTVE